MDNHAGGGVKWAEGVRDDESKMKPIAQRLERYERHTRHCRYCKAALRELGVLEERLVDFSNAMLAAGLVFGLGGAVVGQEGTGGGGRVPRGFGGQRHGVGAGHAARHEDVDSPPRRRHAQAVVRDSTRKIRGEMIVTFEGTLY
jgi:hypothetical protein